MSPAIKLHAAGQPAQTGAALSMRAASHEGLRFVPWLRCCASDAFARLDLAAIKAAVERDSKATSASIMTLGIIQVVCVALLAGLIMYRRTNPSVSGYVAMLAPACD